MSVHIIKNADGSTNLLSDSEYGEVVADRSHSEMTGIKFVLGSFMWFLIFTTMNASTYYIHNALDKVMYGYFKFMLVSPFKFVMGYLNHEVTFFAALFALVIAIYLIYQGRYPSFPVKLVRWIAPIFYFIPYILWKGFSLFY